MNARGIAAACLCGGVFVMALAVRELTSAIVATWSETLTIAVVIFAGIAVLIVALNVGAGVRLALRDRRENSRPIIVSPPAHALQAPDTLRDAERMARVHAIMGGSTSIRVPAFEVGPWSESIDNNG